MIVNPAPWESLAPLQSIPRLRHGFLTRVPGMDVDTPDKAKALETLKPHHKAALEELGMDGWPFVSAEQIHGSGIAVLSKSASDLPSHTELKGMDGFVTDRRGLALGIYVADCAAVYLVDPVRTVAGLVHSGRKGTELGITQRAISLMASEFGSQPSELIAVVSPCIRPPAYEVDFAAAIREQCRNSGIPPESIHDARVCTSSDLSRFYSYRTEKGKTGRMLAVLGWEP